MYSLNLTPSCKSFDKATSLSTVFAHENKPGQKSVLKMADKCVNHALLTHSSVFVIYRIVRSKFQVSESWSLIGNPKHSQKLRVLCYLKLSKRASYKQLNKLFVHILTWVLNNPQDFTFDLIINVYKFIKIAVSMIVRQKRETRDVEWPDSGKTSNVKWNFF